MKKYFSPRFGALRISLALALFLIGSVVVLKAALLRPEAASSGAERTLSFADRVSYQAAIEQVFWQHRLWPKDNAKPKPAFNPAMSESQLAKKVEDYLTKSQALSEDHRAITDQQLQAEIERMASHSRQPEVLRELFQALNNDPFIIAECLARPIVAERLTSASHPATSVAPLTNAATRTTFSYTLPTIAGTADQCADDTWTPTDTSTAPTARSGHTAVWTGTEMIVWGGRDDSSYFKTGGRYFPSTDSWLPTSSTRVPRARYDHNAVWDGSEMIVWGGGSAAGYINSGGRYDPSSDSWQATTTLNAPTGRVGAGSVWTGTVMIIWGGVDLNGATQSGGKYNPLTDSWAATSLANAPAARTGFSTVWTGSDMIVWSGSNQGIFTSSGGKYDPVMDNWTATSQTNAPQGRGQHEAVWTGDEMIVWGGYNNVSFLSSGGRYNPTTDSWLATSLSNAPEGRWIFPAVWSGSQMIVWGGQADSGYPNTGGRYDPATDSWMATTTANAPEGRVGPTGVWSGSEMIVWGGNVVGGSYDNTGGRYCASAASPTPTPTPAPIMLSAQKKKVRGINTVKLSWSGATSNNVDIYRNAAVIVTTPNDGSYIDSTGDTGQAQYTYLVCDTGTQTCSNQVIVTFSH